ncbi:MAG TPA: ABC transporter ATP-binding protein [Candidatus Didemnitutus sp.]|nr:ABC transporter ATP-binding protein [Candidatus Didemnitutus sp.]
MTSSAPPPAIVLESVVKDYSYDWRRAKWRALDGVTFRVARGTICGLLGPNGAGKSTTLRVIAALTELSGGRCEVLGMPPMTAVEEGKIGYLPDEPRFDDYMCGRNQLIAYARMAGRSLRAASRAADEMLALTGLTDAADRRVGGYSRGMRQRLGIAQAILNNQEVILLDEPAAALDPRAIDDLMKTIRLLREHAKTVLLATHFLPHLEELCDQVVVMEGGRVVFDHDAAGVHAAGGLGPVYLERALR